MRVRLRFCATSSSRAISPMTVPVRTDGEQHRTLAGRLDDLDLAGLDDICAVALVAFVEEIFAGGQIDDFGQFK